MNLVLLAPSEFVEGRIRLSDARRTHLLEVLGVKAGSTVRAGLINGPIGALRVLEIGPEALVCEFEEDTPLPEASRVDILLCMPRPKVLQRLLPSLAQLGIRRLMISNAWRVERFYFDAHILLESHWKPLLLEGLSQARDTRMPELTVHRSFAWLVRTELKERVPEKAIRLYADPGAKLSVRDALCDARTSDDRVIVALGPEGGFTDRERLELEEAGFVAVGMSERALKSEVATIALLALVHDALRA